MQILIYGATDIGFMISAQLYLEYDITIIDERDQLPEKFGNLDISHVSGSAADTAVLEKAQASKADLFIACTNSDEANIVACWTIKKMTSLGTVCFVSKPEIYNNLVSPNQHQYQTKYDIDTVIWPEHLLTQDIFRTILVPEAVDVEYFDKGRVKLFEYRIKECSPLCNIRIMDYTFPDNVLIVGITRDDILFIPDGTTRIEVDDKVIFMGDSPALNILAADILRNISSIKTAVIIGGGNVGFFLAQQMEKAKIKVKIFEQDQARALFLANNLKRSMALLGDGTNIELLEEEEVGDSDIVVCVTNNDEKNLLCSLLVKQLGAKRVVTRVGNVHNARLFERVGIDIVVSEREAAMKELLNVLRTEDIDVLATVSNGQGKVLNFMVPKTFLETKVMDLTLPKNVIITDIKRGKGVIIPNGSTIVRANDQLKIFSVLEKTDLIKAAFTK